MAQMMTPRDKVGRVEFLFEQLSDARELSHSPIIGQGSA